MPSAVASDSLEAQIPHMPGPSTAFTNRQTLPWRAANRTVGTGNAPAPVRNPGRCVPQPRPVFDYSARNAIIGSTRVARSAGTSVAVSATTASKKATPA